MPIIGRWTPSQLAALRDGCDVVAAVGLPAIADRLRRMLGGRLRPMPRWMRGVLWGAAGFAIPGLNWIFIWPEVCESDVGTASILVHEHRHLEDGWLAWLYAIYSVWNTSPREYAAYAAEAAFLQQWLDQASDAALRQRIEMRLERTRAILVSLRRHGRLTPPRRRL